MGVNANLLEKINEKSLARLVFCGEILEPVYFMRESKHIKKACLS